MKRVKVIDFTNFGIGGLAVAYLAAYAQASGVVHWETGKSSKSSSEAYTALFKQILQDDHMELSPAVNADKKELEADISIHLYDTEGYNETGKTVWSFYYPDCQAQLNTEPTIFSETIKKDMLIFISKELL